MTSTKLFNTWGDRDKLLDSNIPKAKKIEYLNEELKVLLDNYDKSNIHNSCILVNRLQMSYEQLKTGCLINGHFWVETKDGKIIDPENEKLELYSIVSKANFNTKKFKFVYTPLDNETQEDMIELWVLRRIKKFKKVLTKYKKYFNDGMNWRETLLSILEIEDDRCNHNSIINHFKNENSKIIFGSFGIQQINAKGEGYGQIYYEYEYGYNGREIKPPFMSSLNYEELMILFKNTRGCNA